MTDGLGSQPPIMANRIVNPNASTDEIKGGMLLMQDTSQVGAQTEHVVTRPTIQGCLDGHRIFAVKALNRGVTGSGYDLDMVPLDDRGIDYIRVRTQSSGAAGDVLGVFPESYYATKGAVMGGPILVALEAFDGTEATLGTGTTGVLVACRVLTGKQADLYHASKCVVIRDTFESVKAATNPAPGDIPNWGIVDDTSCTQAKVVGGGVALGLAGADNDFNYRVGPAINMALNNPMGAYIRCKPTQSGTTAGNFIFGLSDDVAENDPITASNALPSSWNGFVVAKLGGANTWVTEISEGANQETGPDTAMAFTSAEEVEFLLLFDGVNAYVYGKDTTVTSGVWTLIHTITDADDIPHSPTGGMEFFFGVRDSATADEDLEVYDVRCVGVA